MRLELDAVATLLKGLQSHPDDPRLRQLIDELRPTRTG